MKLSFSTNGFTEYSVFEAIEQIADIGFEGVELLADAPHLYADSLSTRDLEKLKDAIDRTGLKVANINANTAMGWYGRDFWEPLFEPSLANPDKELRHWRLDYSKKCVDLAYFIGAPSISVTSGRCVPNFDPEMSMDFLRESLMELVEYAEERSIRIGIEYEPGLLVERYEELAYVLEDVHSPWLGANLDLGHSHVLGEDPSMVIKGLGHKIFHVHLEDIKARKHYHLVPGKGDMDFPKLLKILRDSGYNGFATVELYTYLKCPEEAAYEAFKFLRNIPNCV
ncbi:MAG: sugar phosphate isomerase/epimerase family protein [Desulfomonilaceae bacterium]